MILCLCVLGQLSIYWIWFFIYGYTDCLFAICYLLFVFCSSFTHHYFIKNICIILFSVFLQTIKIDSVYVHFPATLILLCVWFSRLIHETCCTWNGYLSSLSRLWRSHFSQPYDRLDFSTFRRWGAHTGFKFILRSGARCRRQSDTLSSFCAGQNAAWPPHGHDAPAT